MTAGVTLLPPQLTDHRCQRLNKPGNGIRITQNYNQPDCLLCSSFSATFEELTLSIRDIASFIPIVMIYSMTWHFYIERNGCFLGRSTSQSFKTALLIIKLWSGVQTQRTFISTNHTGFLNLILCIIYVIILLLLHGIFLAYPREVTQWLPLFFYKLVNYMRKKIQKLYSIWSGERYCNSTSTILDFRFNLYTNDMWFVIVLFAE